MNPRLFLSAFILLGQIIPQALGSVISPVVKRSQPNDNDAYVADAETPSDTILTRSDTSPIINARAFDVEYWAPEIVRLQVSNNKCRETVGDKIEASVTPHKRAFPDTTDPAMLLYTATAAQCVTVEMKTAAYAAFHGRGPTYIGTKGLCGCIALAIVSNEGAVVGHLSAAGDMENKVQVVKSLFANMIDQTNIKGYLFFANEGPIIDYRMFVAGETFTSLLRDRLMAELNINFIMAGYDAFQNVPYWGTLVVGFNHMAGVFSVWVNNQVRNIGV